MKTINFCFQYFQAFSWEQKPHFGWNKITVIINVILNKSKNTKRQKINISNYFYFMKTENKKSNQTCFQNFNLLKMKTVFRMKIKNKNENANQTNPNVFDLHFHFLFSFSENCFHFQKIWILKICLVWFLVFCFHEIKILKIYYILTYCFFVFLNLLKSALIVTTISF